MSPFCKTSRGRWEVNEFVFHNRFSVIIVINILPVLHDPNSLSGVFLSNVMRPSVALSLPLVMPTQLGPVECGSEHVRVSYS